MVKFLFGGGWWTAWYAVMWLGGAMFVGLPVYALIRDAVPKPAGPASLGSVVLTCGAAVFLGAVTLINAGVAARMMGYHWLVVILIAGAACAAAVVTSYMVLEKVCVQGGYAWSTTAAVVCAVWLLASLGALAVARGDPARPEEAGVGLVAE